MTPAVAAAAAGTGWPARFIIAALVVVLALLQYRLWFADGNVFEVRRLEAEVAAERERISRLRERNAALEAEVEDLKQGLDAIEARARSELGMIGRDETFYLVVEPREDDDADD